MSFSSLGLSGVAQRALSARAYEFLVWVVVRSQARGARIEHAAAGIFRNVRIRQRAGPREHAQAHLLGPAIGNGRGETKKTSGKHEAMAPPAISDIVLPEYHWMDCAVNIWTNWPMFNPRANGRLTCGNFSCASRAPASLVLPASFFKNIN